MVYRGTWHRPSKHRLADLSEVKVRCVGMGCARIHFFGLTKRFFSSARSSSHVYQSYICRLHGRRGVCRALCSTHHPISLAQDPDFRLEKLRKIWHSFLITLFLIRNFTFYKKFFFKFYLNRKKIYKNWRLGNCNLTFLISDYRRHGRRKKRKIVRKGKFDLWKAKCS